METEQRLRHIDFTSPSGHSRVSFSFSWCSTGGSAFCLLSLPYLITNWSGPQTPSGVPRAPSAGWWLSLLQLLSNSSGLQLADFLSPPGYIIVQSSTQSPTQAEITVMQFRGHSLPVHQSMSVSWAFTLSYFVSDFFRLLAIGMCHFLPVHHFGMACLAGSKVKIQHLFSIKEIINTCRERNCKT